MAEDWTKFEVSSSFDPEGSDYDYVTAQKFGITPDETGHWQSREPTTGQILKGRKHKTFDLTVKEEEAAGYEIYKGEGGKYYSKQKVSFDPLERWEEFRVPEAAEGKRGMGEEEYAQLKPLIDILGAGRVQLPKQGEEGGLPVDPLSTLTTGFAGVALPSLGVFSRMKAGLSAKGIEAMRPIEKPGLSGISQVLRTAQPASETRSLLPQAAKSIEEIVKESEGVIASKLSEEQARVAKLTRTQQYDFSAPYHRAKVNAIKEQIQAGKKPEVVVRPDDFGNPLVTEGLHTEQAYKELGIEPNYRHIGVGRADAESVVDKLISEGKAARFEREKLIKQLTEERPTGFPSEIRDVTMLQPPKQPYSTQWPKAKPELEKSEFDLLRSEEGIVDLSILKSPIEKFRAQMRSGLEFVQDPRYILNKDPTGSGAQIWRRLAEADRAGAKFMDDLMTQMKSNIKVAPGSEASAKIGKLLDKEAKDITSYEWASLNTQERSTYDFLRAKWDEFGDVLVKKGLLEDKRRIKGYLFRVFDKDTIYNAAKNEYAFLRGAVEEEGLSASVSAVKKTRLEKLEKLITNYEKTGTILYDYIPKEIQVPFLKQRTGATGYSTDAVKAMEIYSYYARRKFFDEPAIKEALELMKNMPPEHRGYTRWFLRNFIGMERPPAFNNLTRTLTTFEYAKDIGFFNMRSAVMNATQNLNTLVELDGPLGPLKALLPGTKSWTREGAYRALFDKDAQAVWKASGHMSDPESLRYGFVAQKLSPALRAGFTLFDKVEGVNREIAYLGSYYKAINEGKSPQMAKIFADEIVYKTQFPYGRIGAPKLMEQMPGGPAFMQFTTFSIKELQLFTEWAKTEPTKLLSYLIIANGAGEGLKQLDIDMSNALGIGGDWVELSKALYKLGKGDVTAAKIHSELGLPSIPGLGIGIAGGGIFPSGIVPLGQTVKDAVTKDWIKALSPVAGYRLYQSIQAAREGEQIGVLGGEAGYPLRDPKSGYVRAFESPTELVMRNILARPYKESKGYAEVRLEEITEETRKKLKQEALWAYGKGDEKEFSRLHKKYNLVFSDEDFKNLVLRRGATQEMLRRVEELRHKQDILFRQAVGEPLVPNMP